MKILLDANISWRLVDKLKVHFNTVLHINFCELHFPISDNAIWDFAKNNDLIIVTNDTDFIDFVNIKGFPPKVVLIVTGNQSTAYILEILLLKKMEIEQLSISNEYGIVEIY